MPTPRKYASHAQRQAAYRRRLAERMRQSQDPRAPTGLGVPTPPSPSRWRGLLRQATRLVETTGQEMEEYYERRSERWQESERGEAFLERLEMLRETQAALEELHS